MKKELNFTIPFSGFTTTDFINCFTSTYMILELISGNDDYNCQKRSGEKCCGCGNCRNSTANVQEKLFMLFDTMCGRSSLRCRFDGEPTEMQKWVGETEEDNCGTDETVEFLFGFAGYEYQMMTVPGEFKTAIQASIDAGKPVIAKVKKGKGRFRVITGYDENADDIGVTLICPDFTNAQHKPEGAPAYDELKAVYIIGNKIAPRFTVIDGLKRIRKVLEYNRDENLWGGYTEKMGLYTADSLGRVDVEEKKARMKRVADTMWHTFNCHNFAEVFRRYRDGDAAVYDHIGDMKKLSNPALKQLWEAIGGPCNGYTHDLAWALIGLEGCAIWTRHAAGYFGEMIELTLCQIAKNDAGVLEAIQKAIEILDSALLSPAIHGKPITPN